MKCAIIYIILPMALLCMMCTTSCKSDSGMAPESEEQMMFEVNEVASRTSVSLNSNLKNHSFSLFGDMDRTGAYFPGLKLIFNGDKVTFINNKWDYGFPMYWVMGQVHSFVALHPSTDIIKGLSDLEYSDSKLSFTYTIPVTNGKIEYKEVHDILVATHRRKYTFDTAGAVKFGFRHLLSRINIAPALDEALMYEDEIDKTNHPENMDEYILFHKIEIYRLKTKASFSFLPAAIQTGLTDDNISTYDLYDNSMADAVLTFREPKKVTNNKHNVNICDDDDAMIVLPQGIDKNAKVVLYYTVNDDNPMRKITFSFSDLPIDNWEAGKSYTYSFTISKAYTGQIKDGSLRWRITDFIDNSAGDRWINEDGTIRQEFDL